MNIKELHNDYEYDDFFQYDPDILDEYSKWNKELEKFPDYLDNDLLSDYMHWDE